MASNPKKSFRLIEQNNQTVKDMLKCIEGENTSMCEAIRQMVDEGIMLGEKQRALDIARRMIEMKYSKEQIADIAKLTKQEVEELSKTIKQ